MTPQGEFMQGVLIILSAVITLLMVLTTLGLIGALLYIWLGVRPRSHDQRKEDKHNDN